MNRSSLGPDAINVAPTPTRANDIVLISYHLWENRAAEELDGLVARYQPDAIVVQEAFVDDLPPRIGHVHLIGATTANHLGLALYVDTDRFDLHQRGNFRLSPSRHDRMKGTVSERLTAARVVDTRTGRDLILGSIHVAPMTDSNRLRRRQIAEAHDAAGTLGSGLPTLLAGDYNYPFFARGLIRKLNVQGLSVARSSTGTYRKRGIIRGVFDLATFDGFDIASITTLAQGASDHHPILITARPSQEQH